MSSSALKKTVKRALFKLEKDRSRRQKLERQKGQLFIFAYQDFIEYITKELKRAKVGKPKTIAKKLEKEFSKMLGSASLSGISKFKTKEMQGLKNRILNGELPAPVYGKISKSTHKIFLIKSYSQVSRYKTKIGKSLEKETDSAVSKSLVTGDQTGLQEGGFKGLQLGHGEYGAAVSATRVLAAERFLDDTGTSDFNETDKAAFNDLRQKIQEYKNDIKVIAELEANTVVDSNGNFLSSFVPLLSGQLAQENQDDGKREKQLLKDLNNSFTTVLDILNQKGSRSNKEAIEDTLLHKFSSKKELKYRGTAKPTKNVKKKTSSGKVTKTFKGKSTVSIAAGAALPAARKAAGKRQRKSNVSSVPFAMIDVFNRKLPETLKKNMGSPRLNYRSGRFSESVRVTDVVQTKKGFPSFGYTYQTNPYQTFEPGYRQGSQERDPRRLIDASMREIAAEFAIGRFFTRRR
jgi:hypothetical protein